MCNEESRQTLGSLLERRAAKRGSKTFFRYQSQGYSYKELHQKSNAIANELRAAGVDFGDVVGIYMYNRPEYLYTLFALAKLGAVAAPIDTRFTGGTLTHVLSETNSEIVVLDKDTVSEYEALKDAATTIMTEFFVGDASSHGGYREFDRLLDGDRDTAPLANVDGSDTCSVIYVQRYRQSYPQGVALPHYSYLNTGRVLCQNLLNLSSDDCVFTTLPFYSSYPIQIGVTGALLSGAEFAFEKKFENSQFWDWIRHYDATVFLYLGRMLSVLHNQEKRQEDKGNPAQYAIGHGFGFESDEAMIANFESWFDVSVLEAYGITPNATLATANRPEDRRLGSVGKPIQHAEVKIVDKNDWELPRGEMGEILVRSKEPNTMFQGFHKDPELTTKVCQNQWIHTNDVGYMDEDGYLYFVASEQNTIHLGRVAGRISSLEIESVIEAHPAVEEAVVLGVPDGQGDEDIKAIVVPKKASLSPIAISEHCEKQLTYQKLPQYIEIRSNIPRSASGKVQKDVLSDTASGDVWNRDSGYELER